MRCRKNVLIVCLCFLAGLVSAGPTPSKWSTVPIFNQAPLEIKLGTYSDGDDPDLLAVVLWNDGNNNRLDAVRIPPPYNGSGITTTALENTNNLFALGDICTEGTNVVVPYIKDFNLEVARFNGVNWTQFTVPGTSTNNFDNADCVLTQDGMFLGSHDLTDGETELFKSTNGGLNYTFYGHYSSAGPFDGAIREPFTGSYAGRYVSGLNQQSNGQVRVTHTSTANPTPNFSHTNVESLPPPSGFSFVKEGAAASNGVGVIFTYNSEGTARSVEVPEAGPFSMVSRDLGSINNNGTQFTFQGGTVLPTFDLNHNPVKNNILWGDYFEIGAYDPAAPIDTDASYLLSGVGGPVDACEMKLGGDYTDETHLLVGGPRVGSTGTNLYFKPLEADSIFTDGFESGDTTAWTASCP